MKDFCIGEGRGSWAAAVRLALIAAVVASGAMASPAASATPAGAVGNPADFPAGKGRDVFLRTCGGCHPPAIVKSHLHDDDGWDETIGKMVQRGAKASEAEQDEIRDYLARNFSPAAKAKPASIQKTARKPGA